MGATITEPGVYTLPAEQYHRDPVVGGSLSRSGAKTLLRCPAMYAYEREHPPAPKREYEIGACAHDALLERGPGVTVIEADSYRTKAAQEERDAVRAAGRIPVLPHEWDEVQAMVAAVRAHPLAGALFTQGRAEETLIWRDERTGIWCRAMVDWLRPDMLVDLKTAESADPEHFRKSAADYGYDIQAWHYPDGARAVGLGALPMFFVVVEKKPPHLVSVVTLDAEYQRQGELLMRRAREIWRDCTEAGVWPAYVPETEFATIPPPRWRHIEE